MFSAKHQKAALVGAVAAYMGLVVFGNVVDSAANFAYVQHVLSMDTVLPHNSQKWRAITNPEVWRLSYVLILVYQIVAACWLLWATVRLFRSSAIEWVENRTFASGALVFTLLLWLVPFATVGGEWFQMWQSSEWNGLDACGRNFTMQGIVLLYLQTPDEGEKIDA